MEQTTRNGKRIIYDHPILMGILNATDDSFYDGGRYKNLDVALKHIDYMIKNGAEIIDIGGESTRPGAEPISEDEELDRVIPLVEKIAKEFNIIISVDTYKSKVAEESLKAGADIINDISGLQFDEKMVDVVKKYNSIIVIMHIKGTPKTMQLNPEYNNVIEEISNFFKERIKTATSSGIDKKNIIIDVGIGFGKKLEHNVELIKNLSYFKGFNLPILLGLSRKSMIGNLLGGVTPEERLYGTLAANLVGYQNGANIIRVHDVKEHYEFFKVFFALK